MIRATGAALLLCLAPAAARADLDPDSARGRPVTRIELLNPSRVRDAEILALFPLGPGAAYDPALVRRGLSLLSQKVALRNVLVSGEPDGAGVALRLEVVVEPLVRSVEFRGNRSLGDARLSSRLRTRVDRPAHPRGLERDAEALAQLYEVEGFPAAKVAARVEPDGSGQWLRVRFEVEEGPPLAIRRIDAPGVPLEPERLHALLGLRPGDPASRSRLQEGVRRVVEVLRRDGYPEARSGRGAYRAEGGGAVLDLPVTAGAPVDVRLEGLDEWGLGALHEVVGARYGEVIDGEWAHSVAAEVEEALRAEGYLEAAVQGEVGEAYGRRRVTLRAERGPLARVEEVVFSGNRAIADTRLRGYLSVLEGGVFGGAPFTHEALDRDLRVVKDYYATQGYLDARVRLDRLEVAPGAGVRLRIGIEEGSPYRLGRVEYEVEGSFAAAEAAAAAALAAGATAAPDALDEARLRILRAVEAQGHPDARVEYGVQAYPERGEVDVVYRVAAGEAVTVGRTVVSGNARTQTHVILREVTFREGEVWDGEKALQSRQRLYRLGYFGRVTIELLPAAGSEEVRDVRVEVEEQDAGAVTLGLGYGTEEGVKGFAAVSHSNLRGSGRSLGAKADFDRFDRSYAVNFGEPWLLGRPFDLRLSLVKSDQEREAFRLSSLAFQSSLAREFTEHLKGSLLYTLESNDLSEVADVADLETPDAYLLSAVGPVVAWDSRDEPFNPRRGFHHTFQAEWATDLLGSQVEYERYLGSASTYLTAGNVTLALLARGGVAFTRGQVADLPVNKRFFLGGRTTVRGFQRDGVGPRSAAGVPVGGDVMGNLKAEVRFPVWGQLGGALFWDAGNVWNRSLARPTYQDLRHAAGAGVRYRTPVGPLALDLAFKLDRKTGEDPYTWHFTVGSAF
ncbi:MAG: outer membrane protein assembly factor BamA [Deferrisomatales bacterium]